MTYFYYVVLFYGTKKCNQKKNKHYNVYFFFVIVLFRDYGAQLFTLQSFEQIKILRDWLQTKVDSFGNTTRLWLGFVNPRHRNGTGRYGVFQSLWRPGLGWIQKLNGSLWFKGEPNKNDEEFCVDNGQADTVYNVGCNRKKAAYAICEVATNFIIVQLESN